MKNGESIIREEDDSVEIRRLREKLRALKQEALSRLAEHRRQEEENRPSAHSRCDSSELSGQIVEAMPQLAWSADPAGRVTYYNSRHREFKGLSRWPENLWECGPAVHPDDRQETLDAWRTALRTGLAYQVEHRLQRADDSFAWYLSWGVPIRNREGRIVRWCGTSTDIDRLKKAEMRKEKEWKIAEEATRAKSEFLANMSHEIRTPMTVFMVAIDHLMQVDDDPDRRQLLQMAGQSAQRLRSLIDDVLDFSRIEARRMELDEESFDVRACVLEALAMFTLPAREKNILLDMAIAPDVPDHIIGDPFRLGQVLINLIGNALKFTDAGEIRVSVQPRGDFLAFTVADTGIGIPEEKCDLIFQKFSQVSACSRKHAGSGLGLAISSGLVELMGGKISVKSREGEGSSFTFTIPVKAAASGNSAGAVGESHEFSDVARRSGVMTLPHPDVNG